MIKLTIFLQFKLLGHLIVYYSIKVGGLEFELNLCSTLSFKKKLKIKSVGLYLLKGSIDPHMRESVVIMVK